VLRKQVLRVRRVHRVVLVNRALRKLVPRVLRVRLTAENLVVMMRRRLLERMRIARAVMLPKFGIPQRIRFLV